MHFYQIAFLTIVIVFYISYIIKMIILRQRGIKGDILGKGIKSKNRTAFERLLKLVSYLGAFVKTLSIVSPNLIWSVYQSMFAITCGLLISILGTIIYIKALADMGNNWRAGFSNDQKTELVTNGIYRWSRNPAFLGFDLLYFGCAIAFPNILNITVATLAIVFFHLQIRGEEEFLSNAFGSDYAAYKKTVRRYWGIHRGKVSSTGH